VTDPVEKKVAKAAEGHDPAEPTTLEARLRRLEEIMSQLEADEVDVERALALFEEGVRHVRAAEKILSETELRVEELLSSGKVRPLDAGEQDGGGA